MSNKAGLNNGHYWDTDLPKPELRPNVAQNRPTLFKYQEPAATQPARKQPAGFIRTTGKPARTEPNEMPPGGSGQLGIPSTPSPSSQLGIPSQSSESSQLDRALKVVADSLYPEWKRAVQSREITPAKAASQKFIWKASADQGDGKQVLSAPETARIWEVWQERAAGDGILTPNPKYQPGNRQPKFVLV